MKLPNRLARRSARANLNHIRRAKLFSRIERLEPRWFLHGDHSTVPGLDPADSAGSAVYSAGDFNRDGIDDVIIAASGGDNGTHADDGEVYVVFGSTAGMPSSFNLSTLNGINGFKLLGVSSGDLTGASVGGGGDLNGDGYDDIVIGAPGADPLARSAAGSAYVVFGSNSFGATFNLSLLNGTNGFRINGAAASDELGRSVAIAGDVNKDGFSDVLVGAPLHDSGGLNAGAAYVIYGSATSVAATLDLASLPTARGFRINGSTAGENFGYSVSTAGDVNGDDASDLVIGAPTGIKSAFSTSCNSTNTVGLIQCAPNAAPGYTLFGPNPSTSVYLVDNQGYQVNSWTTTNRPALSTTLLDDGSLLRTSNTGGTNFVAGGNGGAVEIYDWEGNLTWNYSYSTANYRLHHDVEMLPNGNVLMIAWEMKTSAEAIAAGRNPAQMTDGVIWSEHIIEVQPTGPTTGNIVWKWHAWDHLIQDFDSTKANFGVVANNPQLIDINFFSTVGADWLHFNSIDYNPALNQIMVSVHGFSEVWVIDHSTTTLQAASHAGGTSGKGGDLLYRWGNPRAYDRGTVADRKLYTSHDAQWIQPGLPGAGNILIFNNGIARPGGNASSVEEITPPVNASGNYTLTGAQAYGPTSTVWTWMDSPATSFYAQNISGAHRLANGNTLITNGPVGRFLEVDASGNEVFEYINPVTNAGPVAQGTAVTGNAVFRARKYDPSFPGLVGKDLTPGGTVETGGTSATNPVTAQGAAYVVMGASAGLTNMAISSLNGTNGFKLSGVGIGDQLGFSVSTAGDVNNDGFNDVIVGAPRAKVDGISVGAAYVVLGKSSAFSASIPAQTLNGTIGYRLALDYESDPILDSLIVNSTNATGYNGIVVNFDSVIPDEDVVHVHSSGVPHYTTIGPWAANPNNVTDQNVTFYIPRNPEVNAGTKTLTRLGAIGVWVDGTAIFNWSDGRSYLSAGNWNQLAVVFEGASFDACDAHPPGTGQYHTHGVPTCLINELGDTGTQHSPILGWSFDGFPIYGPYGYTGGNPAAGVERIDSSWKLRNITTRVNGPTLAARALGSYREDFEYVAGSGDLDQYNGRFSPTPEYPNGIYHYYTTLDATGEPAFPYAVGLEYNGVVGPGNANIGGVAPTLGQSSIAVGTAGDHNLDGFDDVVVGDPDDHVDGVGVAGSVVVVHGHGGPHLADTHLHTIDEASGNGHHIHGEDEGDEVGHSVGFAGDVNADGGSDFLVGALGADHVGANSGEAFLVVGHPAIPVGSPIDFGDAPSAAQSGLGNSYPVTSVANGARHAATGPRLGVRRDSEPNGVASAFADNDDVVGQPSDEDGVLFGAIKPGQLAGINLNLQNAATAKVDAWIDFNRDGFWSESERILETAIISGLQTINYMVPAGASNDTSFVRIRVSTAGGLEPTGPAADGEVEDFMVTVGSTVATIQSAGVNNGQATRSRITSIEVQFASLVNANPSDFILRNVTTGQYVTGISVANVNNGATTLATLTFTGGTSVISSTNIGVLPTLANGDYELQYRPTTLGNGSGALSIDRFFRKYGDNSGDDLVSLSDFAAFRSTFGKSYDPNNLNNGFINGLDSNLDGTITLVDFAAFRGAFGS